MQVILIYHNQKKIIATSQIEWLFKNLTA